jgi:hypothetical protein
MLRLTLINIFFNLLCTLVLRGDLRFSGFGANGGWSLLPAAVGFAPNPSRKEDVGSPACFPFGNVHPLIYSMDARHILDRIYRKPLVSGIGGECRSVPLSDIADP